MIKVLDHGFVRLVDSMGDDLSVVRAARVSHDAAWRAGENEANDTKLINYLWHNKHTSPFESVTFSFEVKAPIFIFRQWHRHRTWSFNEVSARYTELPEEFYVPDADKIGVQSKNNKQGRETESDSNNRVWQVEGYKNLCRQNFKLYRVLLNDCGWPRELARAILPVATYSHMFATVNLLNLLKFIALRDNSHAQWEIQQYAKALKELIRPIVPVCIGTFENALK